ncbi:hypothetical protein KQX54_020529 [Cotesia glomerata]|uniref:Uncharacterized protein n=1 Tax=Cotesia glomerata TaxID=32391 RepID=A0AAV7J820_COTGL|nr:hypothetical protein KQX54_020529 [Cotesia glomerata]
MWRTRTKKQELKLKLNPRSEIQDLRPNSKFQEQEQEQEQEQDPRAAADTRRRATRQSARVRESRRRLSGSLSGPPHPPHTAHHTPFHSVVVVSHVCADSNITLLTYIHIQASTVSCSIAGFGDSALTTNDRIAPVQTTTTITIIIQPRETELQ